MHRVETAEIVAGSAQKLLLLGAWLDKPIKPGESLPFTWQLSSYNYPIRLDKVYGELFLNSELIYTTASVPFVVSQGNGDSQLQYETVAPPNDNALRSALYKVGTHSLEFRVTGSGPDANQGPFSTELNVDTEPPPPPDLISWWDMHVAPDQINFVDYHAPVPIHWNSTFAVKTSLRNGGAAAINATFSVGMVNEKDPKDSSLSNVLAFPFQIPPNQIGEAILKPVGPIYWIWFLPVTFIPIGPYDKLYDFSIDATVSDEFGNTYPPIVIKPNGFASITEIDVTVQSWKVYLDIAATAAFAAGAILVWFPWPVCAAGAALATVAAGLAIAASDPPEPDPKYLEKVAVIAPALPKALAAEPTLAPFARVVGALGLITAIQQALSVIQGRLLGARVDGNRAGVQLQTDSYTEEIRNLVAAAKELQRYVREVMNIQGFDELFDPKTIAAICIRMKIGKLSPAMRREWVRAGLTRTAIEHLIKAMRDQRRNPQVAKGIGLNLDLIARSLTRFATRMHQEAPAVLREVIPGTTRAPEGTIIRPWVKGKVKHASRKRR